MLLLFNIIAPGPISFRIASRTASSLYLVWEAPSISNGLVRYYQIEYYPSHTNGVTKVFTRLNVRSYNITGLMIGFEYNVRIAAFTVILGPFSNTLVVFTREECKCYLFSCKK